MEKILVLVGDAAEDLDAMYPIFRLREADYEVHVAAPTRRKVKLVVHDFEEGWDAYTERPGRHLPVDLAFSEAEPEGYAALVSQAVGRPSTSATIRTGRASAPTFSSRTCRSDSYAMACRCRRHLAFCTGARSPVSRR